MKTRRSVVLLSLTIVLLLTAILAPAASASGLAGAGCPAVYYRVARGDTLAGIAARHGVSMWQLQQWNHIANIDRIYVGTVLIIYPSRCYAPRPVPLPKPMPLPKPPPLPGPCSVPGGCTPGVVVPLVPSNVCTDQRAVITSPVNGQQVSGWVTVTGNATHENFAYYKLEYGAGSNPNSWNWFFGGQWPIWQASLGGFNAGALPSGTYTIRVVVVDKTGNYPPPCQVTVFVR